MKHSGILLLLIALFCTLSISTAVLADPSTPPLPVDTVYLCAGETLFDTLVIEVPDPSDPDVSMELVAGPGQLTWAVSDLLYGYFQFNPSVDTAFLISYQVHRSATDSVVYQKKYIVYVDERPSIADQYNSFKVCWPGPHYLKVYASDPESAPVDFVILSGPGSIASDGWITYTPDTAGVYVFSVGVFDQCSGDTATIHDTVTFNSPPILLLTDSVFTLCEPGELCFDFHFSDPDGDQVWFEQVGGPGVTQIIDDSTGRICFTPEQADSAWYEFYISYLDNCEGIGQQGSASPQWLVDTARVLVILNRPPTISCPPTQEFFTCVADTFCFAIDATDPENGPLQWNILSGNAWIDESGQVCVAGSQSSQFDVTVETVDSCGAADTCTVAVTINGNRPPHVQTAADFAMTLCAPETVCFSATADDPDFDLADVTVNFGTWDDATDRVCFAADTAGVYILIVTATDSCGVSDADTTVVAITVPAVPLVDLGSDFTASLCGAFEVCVDATITADSIVSYVLPMEQIFSYSTETGKICFTPDTAGAYTIEFGVVGQCGRTALDTVVVTVEFPPAPFVDLGLDHSLRLCDPGDVCVDVATVSAFQSLVTTIGSYNAQTGKICFYADTAGTYELIATVLDSCEQFASDTVLITVEINDAPVVILPEDYRIASCEPESLCVTATITDSHDNFANIETNYGTIDPSTGRLCLWLDTAGVYEIIVTATDSCNALDADTMLVTVDLSAEATLNLGNDLNLALCAPEEICLDVSWTADQPIFQVPAFGSFNESTNQFCFTPDTAGIYEIIIGLTDACERSLADTVLVTVALAPAPFVDLGDDLIKDLCAPEAICIDVATIANYTSLTTSLGLYSEATGQVCFTPETSGNYEIIVAVTDSCGTTVADTVAVDVSYNLPPVIAPLPDTAVYLCYAKWIFIPLTVTDPDNDIASVTVNQGYISDNGYVCFVPYNGGEYDLIVTATDSCGNTDVDTSHVTVVTDENVSIVCPTDTTVFSCSLVDTFCFPVPGIPDSATVTVSGINTWWDEENQTVCFWSQCGNENRIRMTITTPCSEYHCDFTVTVVCNSAPVVFLPPDSSISDCGLTSLCIPVGISDIDKNLATIDVTGGTYNPRTKRICVDLDGSGTYTITATATDSCGATDSDQMVITILPNTPPSVTVSASDTALVMCEPVLTCFPVSISDPDDQAVTVTFLTAGFSFDADSETICFTPDTSGTYSGTIIVSDGCAADTAVFSVSIETGDYVSIVCPTEGPFEYDLCLPGQICIPLVIDGVPYEVQASFGAWAEGSLCFNADTSGLYNIRVIGTSFCNADTCDIAVMVTIAPPVTISCPGDITLSQCAPDTVAFPYVASPEAVVTVIGDAYLAGDSIRVPLLGGAGQKTIQLVATGTCDADTCSFTVTYTTNRPPSIVLTTPPAVTACVSADVCVKYVVSDPDNNIASIQAGNGVVGADSICFSNLPVGTHQVIAVVTDSCGVQALDTVQIRVLAGQAATILCPTVIPVDTICAVDTICVTAPVSPANATVTVSPVGYYNPQTGQVCVPVSATDTINIRMIASAPCGSDTCDFDIKVIRAQQAAVTVPATKDTLVCLTQPQAICYPVTVTGTQVTVTVSSPATYSNGQVCLTVSEPGTYPITLTATGYCNTVSKTTNVIVRDNQAPVLTVPDLLSFERCADDTNHICIDGIYATDAESDPTLSMFSGVGEFTLLGPDSAGICFVPDTFGVYRFIFDATDGCRTVRDTMFVDVTEKPECDVCMKFWIESGSCTPVGVMKQVEIYVDTRTPMAGFDFLLSFDKSVLTFNALAAGDAITGWEYFTYRLDDVTCGSSCPSRYLRIIGIADMNNGAQHPPVSAYSPNGVLATIEFYVANDQTLGDQFVPINFYWFDCGDNSVSDPSGIQLYVDLRIFSSEDQIIWDEDDNTLFPEAGRPQGLGARDICFQPQPGKPTPLRCIEFQNGGIWICHPDSLDDRGDVNLNGIAYEIGDAVIFSNYFIYGVGVFTLSIPGQTAATDTNADGLTLTVSDLVYLIRVIVGDAQPIPRLNPYEVELALSASRDEQLVTIGVDAPGNIGGALLVYDLADGASVRNVTATDDAAAMDLMWSVVGDQLRVLVFDMGSDFIPSGRSDLFHIELAGDGDVRLAKAEVVDYDGRPYRVAGRAGSLPDGFSLHQNYPNPFNPSTTISFSLARTADWTIEIYNVNGALVRSFTGTGDAGVNSIVWDGNSSGGSQVASGVYFYRFESGDYGDTKKMILLK